jgi:hypothetical protein
MPVLQHAFLDEACAAALYDASLPANTAFAHARKIIGT